MYEETDLKPYHKGQIWYMQDNEWTKSQREMGITVGDRPVLIYNSVITNGEFVSIIPITGTTHNRNGVSIKLEEKKVSTVLIQEIRPVNVSKLTKFHGSVSPEKMKEIDTAMKIYLGLTYDEKLMNRYFPLRKNMRPTFKDEKHPIPEIRVKANTVDRINNKEIKNILSRNDCGGLRLSSLTDEEKNFIITGNIDAISKRFNISKTTIYRYRKKLLK